MRALIQRVTEAQVVVNDMPVGHCGEGILILVCAMQGDTEEAVAQLETAIEALYNAIDTLGDVAQDQSDRGLIAVLNAYAYRPLLAEYERLTAAE